MSDGIPPVSPVPSSQLADAMRDARKRTLELVDGLTGEQLMGPRLRIVNPMLWEIGHAAWFHEHFILNRAYGREPLMPAASALYDSIAIHHDERWDLPLPTLDQTLEYMQLVQDTLLERLRGNFASLRDCYLYQFTTFHEDMHDEAFTWTRQTLAHPTPDFAIARDPGPPADAQAGPLDGDVAVPGGTFMLGAFGDAPFVFDNEKWCHPVPIEPFRIARAPVTNTQFAAFVDGGGYDDERLWEPAGWAWRQRADAEHPIYWQRDGAGGWLQRRFERWVELPPDQPVIHVNWFEAKAWCRWANRRLPSEAEWESAALGRPTTRGELDEEKTRYPWGDEPPGLARCNLDGRSLGPIDVAALPATDSQFGCRQMLGNVWEWCANRFLPYPGFTPDAYKEYSQTLFGHTRVLRGGAWVTRSRMVSGLYRNFFGPDRRDVMAGFRTCAND
ncbi:MAG: selenoneine synthase SenA [Pseudomonadota bacterium]